MPAQYTQKIVQVQETTGLIIDIEQWDFQIDVRDFKIDGALTFPKAGDQIVTDQNDIYQVQAMPGGTVWDWNGPFRSAYIAHTKFIGRQPSTLP